METQQLNPEASSKVLERLRGKHVLITGTTGFLGKVVLEKLIRAVPDIGGIHLLIRGNKRHPDARDRFFEEIATSSVFDRLRQRVGSRAQARDLSPRCCSRDDRRQNFACQCPRPIARTNTQTARPVL